MSEEVFIWRVGKYAGKPITDLPEDFLVWVIEKAERIYPESKQAAARELERRKVEGAPAVQAVAAAIDGEVVEQRPRSTPPAVAAPACAECGHPGSADNPLVHRGCAEVPF